MYFELKNLSVLRKERHFLSRFASLSRPVIQKSKQVCGSFSHICLVIQGSTCITRVIQARVWITHFHQPGHQGGCVDRFSPFDDSWVIQVEKGDHRLIQLFRWIPESFSPTWWSTGDPCLYADHSDSSSDPPLNLQGWVDHSFSPRDPPLIHMDV